LYIAQNLFVYFFQVYFCLHRWNFRCKLQQNMNTNCQIFCIPCIPKILTCQHMTNTVDAALILMNYLSSVFSKVCEHSWRFNWNNYATIFDKLCMQSHRKLIKSEISEAINRTCVITIIYLNVVISSSEFEVDLIVFSNIHQ
jgi:hypothetical protein